MQKKLIIFVILGLIPFNLQSWQWGSKRDETHYQASHQQMENTLARLEKFAWGIEQMSDVDWNPVYAGLCHTINDYGRAVIPLLLRDVHDKKKDWKYRYMLLQRCVFVNGKTKEDAINIVKEYIEVIKDKEERQEVREWAADGLSLMGIQSDEIEGVKRPEAEWFSLLVSEERKRIVSALISVSEDKSEHQKVRWRAIRALSTFSDQSEEIIPILMECSNEPSQDIRARAISTLWGIGMTAEKERIGSILVNKLRDEQDNLVKDQIIYGIKTLEVREAIPLLMESLRTGKYCHKSQAAELLGIMKVNDAVPLLIEGLKDESNSLISLRSAEALGRIADKRAVEPLIDLLRTGRWGETAAIPLAQIGDKRAIQPLMEKLRKEPFLVWNVAQALMMLDAREAIPLIENKMPKGKLYGSAYQFKENFESFKNGEVIDWED